MCAARPGQRCTILWDATEGVAPYRLVHFPRAKLAGLNPAEVLDLDFGDHAALADRAHPTEVELVMSIARHDDLALALEALGVAIGLAEGAGAAQRELALLRTIRGKLSARVAP
jgi:hypothetical protein